MQELRKFTIKAIEGFQAETNTLESQLAKYSNTDKETIQEHHTKSSCLDNIQLQDP